MPAIPLKPQYGPTLGQLLAPRWRRLPRLLRLLTKLAGLGLVLGVVALVLTLQNAHFQHGGPTPFSFSYRDLYKTAPDPGEYVKIERRRHGQLEDSFAVAPLHLPPYRGALTGELPIYAVGYVRTLTNKYSRFQLQGEGKTRVNTVPAYNVYYSALVDGRRVYGRDILLLPDRPHVRDGVTIVMLTSPTANSQVTSSMLVASVGVLQRPLHGFTVG